jgi:TPR repeat protein
VPLNLLAPIVGAFVGGLLLAVLGGDAAAAQDQASVRRNHKDVVMIALPPKKGAGYDVKPIDPSAALDRMVAALDLVYANIAFAKAKVETLKRNGFVMSAYDPNYPEPKSSMATIQVAAFLPHHLEKMGQGSGKNFVVIVSRYGIKWPTRELAAVLVHELVGHGMQHLEDRLGKMRNVDRECGSWLYEELAYQKLGFDKSSRDMIDFRQELEGVGFVDGYCSEFKRYMRKNAASSVRLWESLNPDVPGLLAVFQGYVADLLEKGITGAAQQAVKMYAAAEMAKIFQGGSAKEQYQIAQSFVVGLIVRQDHTKAARWMTRSAEQGHAAAQHGLGAMYDNGQGVASDHSMAAQWYRKAAQQGVVVAQYKLGAMFDAGRGLRQNPSEAAKWYRMAAEKGYVLGQYRLGVLYEQGRGVPRNDAEAAAWYGKSAAQGHAFAQNSLGVMFEKGRCVAKDVEQAAAWYLKAAEQGHAMAQYNLGVKYARGIGVARDAALAAKWFGDAARQGFARAQNNLGVIYEKGRGVSKSEKDAAEWYRKAALQGHAKAQMKIANFYLKGKGVPRDMAESLFWLTVIAERQKGRIRNKAKYLRSRVTKSLSAEQISQVQARVRAWRPQTGTSGAVKGR